MAMNKTEQAEMQRLRELLALNWTHEPGAIDTSAALAMSKDGRVAAWCFNAHSQMVTRGFFSANAHTRNGDMADADALHSRRYGGTSQQRGGPWYESESLALKAMRCALERRYAADLARVDERIAAAMKRGA